MNGPAIVELSIFNGNDGRAVHLEGKEEEVIYEQ
jgi:hypothetical protein